MLEIGNLEDARTLAQAIVNTTVEPFLVLDDEYRVVTASRSFYATFQVDPDDTRNALLYALGDGQWDIPALRLLLETIIPQQAAMDGFEVEHDFPGIGRRTMLLNARQVHYEETPGSTILLAFSDITEQRRIEGEKQRLHEHTEELLRKQQVLLQEMQHRVANSLQIIASILLLKARAVASEETRHHLKDAHQRVMSVAAVQTHLHQTEGIDRIEVGAYLAKLCAGLMSSMVGEGQQIAIRSIADPGTVDSGQAVSLGLIVTELVINALKYAFPDARPEALILITYEVDDSDWKLVVSDNGIGAAAAPSATTSGLGTSIVDALARQLDAKVEIVSTADGRTISITRASFTSQMPKAA